jgi:hypothetical protein
VCSDGVRYIVQKKPFIKEGGPVCDVSLDNDEGGIE